ncbi:MAG: hypothetical protein K2Y37_16170 [Pirellulales bacterium]|nr:hypothetical protein [Pirellulales bacterium]
MAQFGKQFTTPVDGQIYAQPLVVANVSITTGSHQGVHDVVYVATQHASVYAIDAVDGTVLWRKSFLKPAQGVTTVSTADVNTDDITPEIGITSTGVIDTATNTLYVVAKTKEVIAGETHFVQRLHALNIRNGAEKLALNQA